MKLINRLGYDNGNIKVIDRGANYKYGNATRVNWRVLCLYCRRRFLVKTENLEKAVCPCKKLKL